jgi:WG containing repeat
MFDWPVGLDVPHGIRFRASSRSRARTVPVAFVLALLGLLAAAALLHAAAPPEAAQTKPAKGPALGIPAEPLPGCQYLLARSARLGPLCGSQRVQNSRNEPHSGPEELIPYQRKTKVREFETEVWGYADRSGRLVIPPQFDVARRFGPDGLAEVKRDDRWGMVDRQGREVIPIRYIRTMPFSDGLAVVGDDTGEAIPGMWKLGPNPGQRTAITDSAYGFIDRQGKVAIPLEYDWVHPFQEGIARVSLSRASIRCPAVDLGRATLWGLIDTKGRPVLPIEHCKIGPIDGGWIRVVYESRGLGDERVGFVDREGRVLLAKLPYDWAADFWREDLLEVRRQNLHGLIDRKGREVVPLRYENLYVGEGRIRAKLGGKWGFLDTTGKIVIPFDYEVAGDFDQGLACVIVGSRTGFIDRDGRMAIAPQYDWDPNCSWRFSEGLRPVAQGGKWGYIDRRGAWVITPQFDEAWGFSEGLAAVKRGELWGFVDRGGKLVIPPRYFRVDNGFVDGLAYVTVRQPKSWNKELFDFSEGFIDRQGREFFDRPS